MKIIVPHHTTRRLAIAALLAAATVAAGCQVYVHERPQYRTVSSFDVADLNDNGEWVDLEDGTRVWRPSVAAGWQPYTHGHWAYANGSWTWVSYEPFGWAVYHYGSWRYDADEGWLWYPARGRWSPARVRWYNAGDYVGWAPLGPPGHRIARPWAAGGQRYWHVVRLADFGRDNVRSYRVHRTVLRGLPRTTVVQRAPGFDRVRRVSVTPLRNQPFRTQQVDRRDGALRRVTLSPGERRRVERHVDTTRRDALRPGLHKGERKIERKNNRHDRGNDRDQ